MREVCDVKGSLEDWCALKPKQAGLLFQHIKL
jgi:hypothetical protein